MADKFSSRNEGLESPPRNLKVITPVDDVTDLDDITRAITVTTAGLIYADGADSGVNVPFYAPAGQTSCRLKRIYLTGTTAVGIVAWW